MQPEPVQLADCHAELAFAAVDDDEIGEADEGFAFYRLIGGGYLYWKRA